MKPRPTRHQIAVAVCDHFQVSYRGKDGVKSTRRTEPILYARAMISHIAHGLMYSYPEIAPYAGYSSHGGAIAARSRMMNGDYGEDWKIRCSRIMRDLKQRELDKS